MPILALTALMRQANNPDMDKLLGLILCGGESRRMGRDKGLMLKEGIPWACYMAARLASQKVPVHFSINPSQLAAYSAFIPSSQLVVDSPGLNAVFGPLRGLLSGHEKFPGSDLLLLACDMLEMDEGTLRPLIDLYESAEAGDGAPTARSGDFFVYREKDFFQPLCGIYTSAGLALSHTLALEGRLTDYSLQSLLKKGRTVSLPIGRPEAFRNYNTL